MKIAIYIEGGGHTINQRVKLRAGFDVFLNDIRVAARSKGLGPRVIMCGSRDEAIDAHKDACAHEADSVNFLLVDSDGPVSSSPSKHLNEQRRRTNELSDDEEIHLMVQVMETWLIADPETLAKYYDQGFHQSSLPSTSALESVAKDDVMRALNRATAKTTKGQYQKIKHASELLAKIDPQKVQDGCDHCKRFFTSVLNLIERA